MYPSCTLKNETETTELIDNFIKSSETEIEKE